MVTSKPAHYITPVKLGAPLFHRLLDAAGKQEEIGFWMSPSTWRGTALGYSPSNSVVSPRPEKNTQNLPEFLEGEERTKILPLAG